MTLVEILLGMAILAMLATLAYSLHFFGLKSFFIGGSQANLQQNVRLVSEVFRKDLRNVNNINLIGKGEAINPQYSNSFSIEGQSLMTTLKKEDGQVEIRNLTIDNTIEDIIITFKSSFGQTIFCYEIKGTNNYTLKDQILLNNLAVDDMINHINLDTTYSLKEKKLVYSQ